MVLRSDWSDDGCSIARAIDAVGDPWVLLILREALAGARRFDEFNRRLGIADNVLSARLRRMVGLGLLDHDGPVGVQRSARAYTLTSAGEEALAVLHAFSRWGEAHTAAPAPQGNLGVICRACGARTDPRDTCARCRRPLPADIDTQTRPGVRTELDVDLTSPLPLLQARTAIADRSRFEGRCER